MNLKSYLIILFTISGSFYLGYSYGKNIIQNEWNQNKIITSNKIIELQNKLSQKEIDYAKESAKLKYELNKANENYTNSINNIRNDYEYRLLKSNERASIYRSMSEAGEARSRDLAEYTAKLDRSLTEGTQLVKELRDSVEFYKQKVDLLTKQLIKDRELMEK